MDPTEIQRVQAPASWKDQSDFSEYPQQRNKALCIGEQLVKKVTLIPSSPYPLHDTRYRIYSLYAPRLPRIVNVAA